MEYKGSDLLVQHLVGEEKTVDYLFRSNSVICVPLVVVKNSHRKSLSLNSLSYTK